MGISFFDNAQASDIDLTTWAGISPSANVITFCSAAGYSAMRTALGVPATSHAMASHSDEDTYSISTSGSLTASNYAATNLLTACATNAGALDFSVGSKTLTVADNCTINQSVQTTSDVTFDDVIVDKLECNEALTFDAVQTATGDSTTTIDWGLGNVFYFTFGAMNETFTFTAPPGVARLYLFLKQDGTGSRTATWPGTVLWPGNVAPTLTTTAAYVDIVSFIYDGTNYFGVCNYDFR